MIKRIMCLMLSVLMLSSCISAIVFAGKLPDIKLEIPEFKVPDDMPDAFESLRKKYELALEELRKEGFEVNNFPDGLGELEPPEGFGSTLDELPDAESLFIEKYGDMWKERPLNTNFASSLLNNKDEAIKGLEKNMSSALKEFSQKKISQKELTQKTLDSFEKMSQLDLNNYISTLESKYKNMFNQPLSGEAVYKQMKNIPSFQITNKWADLMKSPSDVKKEYSFKTEQEIQNILNSSKNLPEGYEEALKTIQNTQIADTPEKPKTVLDNMIDGIRNGINGIKNGITSILSKILPGSKNSVEEKAEKQKQEDAKKYEDIFRKYYYKGGQSTSKEQDNQRKKILEVFEKYGIYSRNKDRSKAGNAQEMGKLIEQYMDLLKKEIPDFKAFE